MQRFLKIPEWAWLTLGLALRVAWALKLDGRMIQIDENAFDAAAWSLAVSQEFGSTPISPLAPIFYGLFYLTGHYPVLPRLAQAAVSMLTAREIGRTTNALTGSENAGRLALALSSIYPFFIYYSGILMPETLYIGCLVMGIRRLSESINGSGSIIRSAAGAGMWLGLAAVARSEAAFVWLVIWIFAAAATYWGKWNLRAWTVAVICWTLPIVGWCARNKRVHRQFTLDAHAGVTVLHGTMFFELNEIDTGLAFEAMRKEPFYKEAMLLPHWGDRDAAFRKEFWRFMYENPGRTLRQWRSKFVNFWRFYPRTDKAYAERVGSDPAAGANRWVLVAISLLFEPWMIVGGIVGLGILTYRDPRLFPVPLLVLGIMGIHIITVSQMRYRLPVMPWLILGVCWLLAEQLPARRPR